MASVFFLLCLSLVVRVFVCFEPFVREHFVPVAVPYAFPAVATSTDAIEWCAVYKRSVDSTVASVRFH